MQPCTDAWKGKCIEKIVRICYHEIINNVGLWEVDFETGFENDIEVLKQGYDTFSKFLINEG